jgi:cation:H+ antiporter
MCKIGLGLLAFPFKNWLGLVFFATYAVYFRREVSGPAGSAAADGLEALKLLSRSGRLTPWRLVAAALFYLAFVGTLVVRLG